MPKGFFLEYKKKPSAQALNRLLSACKVETYPPNRLALALENSNFCLSILEEVTGALAGFVRVTSDKGLNANLWNLAAQPGKNQGELLVVLVHHALSIIRRDMPGCSISISAPSIAIKSLEEQGFLIDPGGIRAMGFRLS